MKTLVLTMAALGLFALTGNEAQAQGVHFQAGGLHFDVGNPHGSYHSRWHHYSHRPRVSYYGSRSHGYGRGGGHGHSHWHDTSHYDYYPGGYVRHYDHYDYVPGHYRFHRDGHWDHH